jgi:hypothetical protein
METMKRTILSSCELRVWLEANQGTIKQAVLAEPSGRNFITSYLDKAGIGFDPDDSDCQRVIAVAGSWVTRWRLGYQ